MCDHFLKASGDTDKRQCMKMSTNRKWELTLHEQKPPKESSICLSKCTTTCTCSTISTSLYHSQVLDRAH